MPNILQLRQFCVHKLHVEYPFPDVRDGEQVEHRGELCFDYDVYRQADDDTAMALDFRLSLASETPGTLVGYTIDVGIFGEFGLPDDISEEQRERIIRINGGMILYGILRGELAAFTGSFPGGKILLPTVYMPDVVKDVEQRKAAAGKNSDAKLADDEAAPQEPAPSANDSSAENR